MRMGVHYPKKEVIHVFVDTVSTVYYSEVVVRYMDELC